MAESLERHLADFLKSNPGPNFLDYRRRCLEFWTEQYGQSTADRVKAIVAKEWKK